jgi:hypothetical protein
MTKQIVRQALEAYQRKRVKNQGLRGPLRKYITAQITLYYLSAEDEALAYLGTPPQTLYQVMKQLKLTYDKPQGLWRRYKHTNPDDLSNRLAWLRNE